MPIPKLSPRALKFVDEYLVDLCAKDAAARAGYRHAGSTGSRLLQDERVQAIVRRRMETRAQRVEVKQDDVLRDLLMRRDHPDTPPAVAVKVDELLMRHLGMLHDKLHVSGSIAVRVDRPALLAKLERLLDAEQPTPHPVAQA